METQPQIQLTAGAALYQRQGITITAMLLALALLVSVLGNLYQAWSSSAIHYVTLGSGARLSRPGDVPDQALRDLATGFVMLLGNGTSAGLVENWRDAERYMSNNARDAFSAIQAEQLPLIHAGSISLTTENVKVKQIETKREGGLKLYVAHLSGLQTVRYGTMSMGAVESTFRVTMLTGNKGAVHGLWIADFYWPPMAVPTGDVARGARR